MKQLHFKIILNKLETQDQVLPIYLKTGTQPDRQKDKQALSISNNSMSGPELTLHPRPQENRRNCPNQRHRYLFNAVHPYNAEQGQTCRITNQTAL